MIRVRVGVSGDRKSGKTIVLSAIIEMLKAQGYTVKEKVEFETMEFVDVTKELQKKS